MLDKEIVSIFESISETMLGVEVDVGLPPRVLGAPTVTAWVDFSGGFSGVLTATFSEPLARALTRILMQQSFAESSREDVCDTIGELVNIVAGNLKGLLPAGCQLSLPYAEFGQHPQLREVEMSLGRAELRLFGEPVCMELSASPGLNPSQ